MTQLEQLLETVVSNTDAAAVERTQQQPQGMQGMLRLVTQALQDSCRGSLEQLLEVLLARNVEGCCTSPVAAEAYKESGNRAFKEGRLQEAVQYYSEALRLVDETTPTGASLGAALYCNRALAALQTSPTDPRAAEQDASCAIICARTSTKAWYRRACARAAMGHADGALHDALEAARLQQQQLQQQQQQAAAPVAASQAASEVLSLVASLQRQLELAPKPSANKPWASEPSASQATTRPAVLSGIAQQATVRPPASASSTGGNHATQPTATGDAAQHAVEVAASLAAQCSGGALLVGWSLAEGRYLAAARDLQPGSDVLQEGPFTLALTRSGRRKCCHRCGKQLEDAAAVWFCRACPLVQFCSLACRDVEEAHLPRGPECGRPWTALLPVEAVLALRTARRLLAGKDRQGLPSAGEQVVATLEEHFTQLPPSEAVQLSALALLLHATWQGAQQHSSSTTTCTLSSLDVLHALCQIRVNGIAVVPPARGSRAERLGLAVYPVASMMNHSCRPNVSLYFKGATAVVRTLEAIPIGAPLLHCYGPQEGEMSQRQRQLALLRQYCFECRCAACASVPCTSAADAELVGLLCSHCGRKGVGLSSNSGGGSGGSRSVGAIQPPGDVAPGLLSRFEVPATGRGGGSSGCSRCGAVLERAEWFRDLLPRLQQAAGLAERAQELVQAAEAAAGAGSGGMGVGAAEQAVQLLEHCLEERQRLLHPHNQLLGATHNALARALHAAGRHTAAASHLRASLALLERHYPPASTAVAFEERQLAAMLSLACEGGENSEARALEEKAAAVLRLHFGDNAALQ